MKKLFIILAALLLGTFATWAQLPGLSFTIWPQATGPFELSYSTYNAPNANNVFVDWGDGNPIGNGKAETGSNPSKIISGAVTVRKPIKIYSNYLDAIEIRTPSVLINCENNNPQLQYIYYFKDNLSPQNLETLYLSLYDRNSKTNWGELHLSQTANIADAGNNIRQSNAFMAIDKKWHVCSMKARTGSSSARINWELNEANCKTYLIPAITLQTPTTANITDLQLGIKQNSQWIWSINSSTVSIVDGNNSVKSVNVSSYTTYFEFASNAPKLTVKGIVAPGTIRIYGAMVSDIATKQISALSLLNTSNMRYINTSNCSLTEIPGLTSQTILEELYLNNNTNLTSIDVQNLPKLKELRVINCYKLNQLLFNTTSLEKLYFSQCDKLKLAGLSTLSNATKLTSIDAGNIGWDACEMNELYAALRSPAPAGAKIYVENEEVQGGYSNGWEGSNKTIATNKGWSVIREYNAGAEQELTGDGGACSFTRIPDNNFFNALKALGYANGAIGNDIPTANLKGITELDVVGKNISDLTGIQDFLALTELYCYNNNLTSLNVSKNTKLVRLYCQFNILKSLDLFKNTDLAIILCNDNQLSILDLSKNIKLKLLHCYKNASLTSLDLRNGNNEIFIEFSATNNPKLTCIYVDNKDASYLSKWYKDATAKWANNESDCGGTVAYTLIPDANFLKALKDLGHGVGAVGNTIPTANLSGITELDVSSKNISDLTGIQDFVALKELKCDDNEVSVLDISKNTVLELLWIDNNKLQVLDISKNKALTELWCQSNQLTTLDVSQNTALISLSCKANKLTNLDVSKNTELLYLDCSDNQLTNLDVSKNTGLSYLLCNDNNLTSLDVRNGNNANITEFDATKNPNLTCIYVDNKAASYLSAWKKDASAKFVNTESECNATVTYTHIPDNNFLQALKALGYGTGAVANDIPTANLKTITSLDVSDKNISDLTGIQDFVALKELKCDDNEVSVLDISKNTVLELLWIDKNNLKVLDVSKNTALTELWCQSNQLTTLDVSNNKKLQILGFRENQISVLDVSKNIALTGLACGGNSKLTVLDVSKNTALEEFHCYENNLISLDVSKNTELRLLYCDDNKLTVLNLSKNTKLTELTCYNNQLTSLDIRNGKNANITIFDATNNPNLSCIYVDNKTASYLSAWKKDATAKWANNETDCGGTVAYTLIPDANFLKALKDLGHGIGAVGNNIPTANLKTITSLDVSDKNISDLTGIQDFVGLEYLYCHKNNLLVLDISKNLELIMLACWSNNLSSLDVSKNTALIGLDCEENEFKVLDVSKNIALTKLSCSDNKLTSSDVSKNTKLTALSCNDNELTSLDLSKNTALIQLSCEANKLTSLDVSKNTALTVLWCHNNQLTSLDVRNGNNANITDFNATNNPNLTCIYVNDKAAGYLSGWEKDATAKWANNETDCGGTVAYTLIPDANFLQALKDLGHGTGAVGNNIPTANLKTITSLDVAGKDISDLTGIQDFVSLGILKCYSNSLTNLDVSKNKALTFLDCEQNHISSLNISGNTALITLSCGDNALTNLNLSANLALEELVCYENRLESLDISKNTKLTSLSSGTNPISVLDVSQNTALIELDCSENGLNRLDVSKNNALTILYCHVNNLTSLDLSRNTKLTRFICSNNSLTTVDIRNGNNANVTYFDATKNPNLTCIYVNDKAASYLTTWVKDATAMFANNETECGTSVNNINEQLISIYPNPTKGILHFDFSGENVQKILILDVLGKTVFEKNKLNPSETVDISGFANGMYMVIIQTNNGSKSYKVIKE